MFVPKLQWYRIIQLYWLNRLFSNLDVRESNCLSFTRKLRWKCCGLGGKLRHKPEAVAGAMCQQRNWCWLKCFLSVSASNQSQGRHCAPQLFSCVSCCSGSLLSCDPTNVVNWLCCLGKLFDWPDLHATSKKLILHQGLSSQTISTDPLPDGRVKWLLSNIPSCIPESIRTRVTGKQDTPRTEVNPHTSWQSARLSQAGGQTQQLSVTSKSCCLKTTAAGDWISTAATARAAAGERG